jgi:putative FmdB family regulatory protein
MPTYSFECLECEKEFEEVRHLSEYEKPATCECGGKAKRIIAIAQRAPTFTDKMFSAGGYYDTSLNKVFTSASHKKAWMKKHGFRHTGGDHMTRSQERRVLGMRQWGHNARNARRD